MIASLGYSEKGYDEALQLLDERYGGEFRTYQAMINEVRAINAIREEDAAALEAYVNTLSVLVNTLKSLNREGDLQNGFLFQD